VSVTFSDPSLVQVEQQEQDWLLTSLKAFQTEETLTVEFEDGETLVIPVTDADTVLEFNNIPDMKVSGSWENSRGLISAQPNVILYDSDKNWLDNFSCSIKLPADLHIESPLYWFEISDTEDIAIDEVNWLRQRADYTNNDYSAIWLPKKAKDSDFLNPSISITLYSTQLSFKNNYGIIRQKTEFVMPGDTALRPVEIYINGLSDTPAESGEFWFPNRSDNGTLKTSDIASIEPDDDYYAKRSDATKEADVTISSDGKTYQIWLNTKYHVEFEPNGGTGAMNTQTFIYGESQNLVKNVYHKERTITYDFNDGTTSQKDVSYSYEFNGWATTENGEKVYDDEAGVKDLTSEAGATVPLYAVWTIPEEKESMPTPNTRKGSSGSDVTYRFLGWYTAKTGGEKVEDPYALTEDATLYAHWEALSTLTINKIVDDQCAANLNQIFLFEITKEGDPDFRMTVMVEGSGERTIYDVPVGTYYVRENCNWSWLYDQGGNVVQTVEVTDKVDKPVDFQETLDNVVSVPWLVDFTPVTELFAGGKENAN
jgi:uncharacterized repeat protein (TIGR02543 family)